MLRRRLHVWRRSFKRHVADVENIAGGDPAMTRIDWSSAITKTYAYKIKQNLFLLLGCHYYDDIAHFFSYYHSQRLLFSPTKNNFSMTLTPIEKPRYTYWSFFVDSIYSKTIDIIINNIDFLFLNRGPMCKVGHPDNGAILQVAF